MRTYTTVAICLLLGTLVAGCGETTYRFDDVDVGGDESGRTPRERTNSQFVRAAYADLLGRTPESYEFSVNDGAAELFAFPVDEQQILLAALDGVGDPAPLRSLLISGLLASDEVEVAKKSEVSDPEGFIREQFRFFLGREPGVYELAAFMDEWTTDSSVNPTTVIRALMESREYQTY